MLTCEFCHYTGAHLMTRDHEFQHLYYAEMTSIITVRPQPVSAKLRKLSLRVK